MTRQEARGPEQATLPDGFLQTLPQDVYERLLRIGASDPHDYCSHEIFDGTPFIFSNRFDFISWKTTLARALEVDPYDLIVVGSSASGVSLAPHKGFSLFRTDSDIDLAVVSARHFDSAWATLRSFAATKAASLRLDRLQKDAIFKHRNGLLFDGCIATERFLPVLEFGAQWTDALGTAQSEPPIVGHDLNTRVYRDINALREYQMRSVRAAKQRVTELLERNSASE